MTKRPSYDELKKRVAELEAQVTRLERRGSGVGRLRLQVDELIASLPAMAHSIDHDGRLLAVSDIWLTKLAYRRDEVIGRASIEFLSQESQEFARSEALPAFFTNGYAENIPYQFVTRSGAIVEVLMSAIVLRDSTGAFKQSLAVMTDVSERNRAVRELEKKTIMLGEAEKLAGLGSWEGNLETGCWAVSDNWRRIHGCRQSLYRTSELLPLVHPDDRGAVEEALAGAVGKGAAYRLEHRILRPDNGQIRHLAAYGSVICNELGKAVRLYGASLDITESRRAAEVLAEAERKWRNILINTPQIGISLDSSGKIVFVNTSFLDMTGWQEGEVLGGDWFELFIPARQRETVRNIFFTTIHSGSTGQYSTYENEIVCRDGSERNIAWSNVLSFADNGEMTEVTCLGVDLTERRRAEEELRRSHERFLTVLDSIDAMVYVAEMDTNRILFANKKVQQSCARDVTGEHCWRVFRGEEQRCRNCTNDRLVDARGRPTGVSVWHDRNPLTGRWFINQDRAIPWLDGRLVKLQIATDITEVKELEERLRQAHKMEAIGTLAGGIAHDFNNMLGIIVGNAELAAEDIPAWNPAREYLTEIRKASMRAKEVVRQLLNFSRGSSQKKGRFDLAALVTETLHLYRTTAAPEVEVRVSTGTEPLVVEADSGQLRQVIVNLCTNAMQAMEQGGGVLSLAVDRVDMDEQAWGIGKSRVAGRFARLTVSDTGSGIAPEIIDRVFDPYFTTREVGQGSGLGLSIIHGIIAGHQGEIALQSDSGEGTSVTILLPLVGSGWVVA